MWECASATCPDAVSVDGYMPAADWQLLRAIGDIVTEFADVECFEYEEYMYIITGDIIFEGDDIFECTGDGDACSALLPSEDLNGDYWTPLDGAVAEVELTEIGTVEALPWWVYADDPSVWVM